MCYLDTVDKTQLHLNAAHTCTHTSSYIIILSSCTTCANMPADMNLNKN